jgi:hypothetical protein
MTEEQKKAIHACKDQAAEEIRSRKGIHVTTWTSSSKQSD